MNILAFLWCSLHEKYRQAGFDYSVLEVLDYYALLAESTNDIDSCKSIYVEVSEEYS